jgi:3-isopropylmalate/(R)-2-methylmalate dehydratase large subunit
MGKNLYEKVFDRHTVKKLPSGQYQLMIGLHLIHEVTSPQAFEMIREKDWKVKYPERTFATVDHIIPTTDQSRPLKDAMSEEMLQALETNTSDNGITFASVESGNQGVIHIFAPEAGLTQPGITVCCGDSHTSTHGAFGSIAFGIGTSQVRDVLATQTLSMAKLKVRRIEVNGDLGPGVYAKDIALYIINRLGVKGGVGFAYEFAGTAIDNLSMEARMTICNMSIEGGARVGYINPDQTTYDYIKGKEYAPAENQWAVAQEYWESVRSDDDAAYDDLVVYDAADIEPFVTWGITPAQSIPVNGQIPEAIGSDKQVLEEALEYMSFKEDEKIIGNKVDVAFIGSCTNGRFSDFEEVINYIKDTDLKVSEHVQALVVPGSMSVKRELVKAGYDKIFVEHGFEFREAGCSMCLAMNPDKLIGDQICASSSNRNFKGRQGSTTGRTLLMSPVMVAACAIAGEVTDARELFSIGE